MVHPDKNSDSKTSDSDSSASKKSAKNVCRVKKSDKKQTRASLISQCKKSKNYKELTSSSEESSDSNCSENELEEKSAASFSENTSNSDFSEQEQKSKKVDGKNIDAIEIIESSDDEELSDKSSGVDTKPRKLLETQPSSTQPSSVGEDTIEITKRPKRKCTIVLSSSESDQGNTDDESSEEEAKSKKNKRRKLSRKKEGKKSKKKRQSGRKEIRTVLKKGELTEETKDAEKQERERRKRLEKSKDNKIVEVDLDESFDAVPLPITKRLALQKTPLVEVHSDITVHLKPHQVEGIQFIWDNLIETTEQANKGPGSGCILAHCMGLGKTLQTISVLHTILTSEHLSFKTALVVAPLNTLINWINEFNRWMPEELPLTLYNLHEYETRRTRIQAMRNWHKSGGVMVMGYDMFRLVASGARIRYKKWRTECAELLVDPGPDFVVCDEGHKLKNSESNISVVMSKIKSLRRLVLTGTPLQNNLMEYQCMVNFVKPNLLGSSREFRNRFVNPIQNGQHSDSTPLDVRLMKKRCHVLHNMLRGFVQRKDYTALAKYLCEKLEFIIKVRLSPLQNELYRLYLNTQTNRGSNPYAVTYGSRDTGLFADYQCLMRVWTHPRVLRLHTVRKENSNFVNDESSDEYQESSEDEEDNNKEDNKPKETLPVNGISSLDSGDKSEKPKRKKSKALEMSDESNASETSSGEEEESEAESSFDGSSSEKEKVDRVRKVGRYELRGGLHDDEAETSTEVEDTSWYASVFKEKPEDFENIESGGKLAVLFEILYLAKQCDDKVLVFSQSLLSLDLIEEMLQLSTAKAISIEEDEEGAQEGVYQKWYKNVDYFRIDGSSLSKSRQKWIDEFNSEEDRRARLFLISTKAGSLGVNLVAANRVVIFDASWNPTHDVQSIFRVYRFGQTKSCFIYRLIAQGSMEEKIYDRQVTKQSLSFRVVDEQQINRYFTAHDLQELYTFTPSEPSKEGEPGHTLPKDKLLAELLVGNRTKELIASYHKHDSLLDHQEEEELTEEERRVAWEEYEREKAGVPFRPPHQQQRTAPVSSSAIANSVGEFYKRQLLAQQQLLKLQREEMQQKSSGSSSRNRESVFAQVLQVSEQIIVTQKKMKQFQPLSMEQTIAAMRQMPLYDNMKEDSLKVIAFEIRMRRAQALEAVQQELKTLQLHLHRLNVEYQKMVAQAESAQSFPSQSRPIAPKPATTTSAQAAQPPFLQQAGLLARSAFAHMLQSHGLKQDDTSITKQSETKPNDKKSEAIDLTSGESPNSEKPTCSTAPALTSTPDENMTNEPETSTNNLQLNSSKTETENLNQVSVSLTKLASNISERLSQNDYVNANNFEFSVWKNPGSNREKSDSKPVVKKSEKEPKALVKSVKPSSSSLKRKKARQKESSDEEFPMTDEEDDWELAYLKKSKSQSRRTRN